MEKVTNFGVYVNNQAPAGADHVRDLRNVVERAVHAERNGFDSIHVTEHIGGTKFAYYEPLTVMTAIAENTERVKLGQGIILAPFYHPVRLALRAATMDTLSNGRVVLGIGTGYRQREFEHYGIELDERLQRMSEVRRLIKRLWREDHVSFGGEHYEVEDLTLYPKPVQEDGIPIWVGMFGDWGIRKIAQSEESWWASSLRHPDVVEEMTNTYVSALNDSGRTVEEVEMPLRMEVSVAEDHETAVEAIKEPIMEKFRAYLSEPGNIEEGKGAPHITTNPRLRDLDDPSHLTFDMIEDLFVIGTPDEVIERLEGYREMGYNHFVIRPPVLQMDEAKQRKTIDVFGEKVIPHFRDSG